MRLKHTVTRSCGGTHHTWRYSLQGPSYRLVLSDRDCADRAARRRIAAEIRHLRKVLPDLLREE